MEAHLEHMQRIRCAFLQPKSGAPSGGARLQARGGAREGRIGRYARCEKAHLILCTVVHFRATAKRLICMLVGIVPVVPDACLDYQRDGEVSGIRHVRP